VFKGNLATSHYSIGNLLSATGEPSKALVAYEQALAIQERLAREHPTVTEFQRALAASHYNISNLLVETGKPSEAMTAYEQARDIRLRLARDHPTVTQFQRDLASSHSNIGSLLRETGKLSEALAAHKQARDIHQRLVRDHPESHEYASDMGGTLNNLALLDLDTKRFAEARGTLRTAITWQKNALATKPKHPTYRQFLANHFTNLITAARGLGDESEVAEAQRALDELQASDPRFEALDYRVAAVLQGVTPRGNAERLALGQRAYDTKRYAAAARLWAEALDSDPKLAADRQRQHPYNASCAAALAASGQGKDAPLDRAAKHKFRQQAIAWLHGELAAWEPLVEKGPAQARTFIVQTLRHWQQDTDLASVRDPEALAALPEPEREEWQALWASPNFSPRGWNRAAFSAIG
jgi:tetratricopeptide (TPR) repeat protein